MRLEAQIKGGFYPAAPEAVDECLRWLQPPEDGDETIPFEGDPEPEPAPKGDGDWKERVRRLRDKQRKDEGRG